MKRQNSDFKIFIVSIIINLLILFLIPKIEMDEVVDKKLKVGLVTLETTTKKIVTKPKSKSKATSIKKEKPPEKKPAPKETSKPTEQKLEVKETKKLSLDDLSRNIAKRDIEFLAIEKPSTREVDTALKNELLDRKNLEVVQKKPAIDPAKDITISKDNAILEKSLEFQSENRPTDLSFEGEGEKELDFETIVEKNVVEELPNGYRLGVDDGDTMARWDQSNREPRYPETAQLKGMQGKVLLKIQIDETGKVVSVYIEKGSGVPDINMAIEEIARTWKIYLTKNGLNIKGNVSLEYSFKLLGTSN